MHSFRPIDTNDKLTRDNPISVIKLLGEGILCESKIILGWLLNTRSFHVYLPLEKSCDWIQMIDNLISYHEAMEKVMDSLFGRLNHVGYILPTGKYFLNRLQGLLNRCQRFGKQKINESKRKDLILWKTLLDNTSTKILSINNITCTTYNILIHTDACEHGIGRYDNKYNLWKWILPEELRGIFSINLLKFIALVIGITIEIKQNPDINHIRILSMTDRSNALSWMYKAFFLPLT